MFNERAFIAQVEAATPGEFARLIANPGRDEEKALRIHFGDERFERLRELAAAPAQRGRRARRGNVVVIHGIMGGELTTIDRKRDADRVWVNLPRLIGGSIARLRLAPDGRSPYDPRWEVRATGMLKREYGEQLLWLAQQWEVRAYWYDWRRDLRAAADQLADSIDEWFGADAPVHIVAHSMGGLVSRAFIQRHPRRWERMQDPHGLRAGGRLVMLGTPNHGSFAVPQIVTGLEGMVRKLCALDLSHNLPEMLHIVNSFPGSLQMLPSPLVMPEVAPLYEAAAWGAERAVPQRHLDDARRFHDELYPVVDPARMIYVAGYDQRTYCGIRELRVADRDAYQVTFDGDGRVPHKLGLLTDVPTYYVREVHGTLPRNAFVLKATDALLADGHTADLPTKLPARRAARAPAALREAEVDERARLAHEEDALELYARQQGTRGAASAPPPLVTADERRAEEIVLRGWVGDGDVALPAPATAAPRVLAELRAAEREARAGSASVRRLTVQLLVGDVRELDTLLEDGCDAIAVGHYVGVRPQFGERALDEAISRPLSGARGAEPLPAAELLLTSYTDRGTLRGELGQPFFLPDPRRPERLIAVAGMGLPGRFGAPELSVLARELVWALGRLGRRHLASLLIGAGDGNLGVEEAVAAWLRGVQQALAGDGALPGHAGVDRITFIERAAARAIELDRALQAQDRWLEAGDAPIDIEYRPFSRARVTALRAAAREARIARAAAGEEARPAPEPSRITLTLERRGERGIYRFGAVTSTASVPEREVSLDPQLVEEANDELPTLTDVEAQLRRGRYLERLLLPRELRSALSTSAPLVMLLDAATARIHWEMIAQPDAVSTRDDVDGCFLGTSRGFTRQLRTTFAQLPDAPPPVQRPLRVLVVADPAEDQPLRGARREGTAVAQLFERYAASPGARRQVVVKRLIGPREATRTAVLQHLFDDEYDILHYAGHCMFDPDDVAASGWIFSDGRRLSAHELRRVDRIPRFVFSNACESGITPDRSEMRNAALAPSFAEAFFERGVSNFVCTAWPVGDDAALEFALHLYSGLLGLPHRALEPAGPLAMHEAMCHARVAVGRMASGRDSWGAYQHYGSPHYRLLEPQPEPQPEPARRRAAVAKKSRQTKKGKKAAKQATKPKSKKAKVKAG